MAVPKSVVPGPGAERLEEVEKRVAALEASAMSADEAEALRSFMEIAPLVAAEQEYRAAKRLVLKTWRATFVIIAGLAAGVTLLWAQVKELLRAALGV